MKTKLVYSLGLALTLTACAQNLPSSVTDPSSSASSSSTSGGVTTVTVTGDGASTSASTTTATTSVIPGVLDVDGNAVVNGAQYYFRDGLGNCLDDQGDLSADGNVVQPYTCGMGNTAQEWTVVLNSDGASFHLVPSANAASSLDLNTYNVPTTNNFFQIWTYLGGSNQNFTFVAMGSGYALQNVLYSTQCLNDTSASGTITGHMYAATCSTSAAANQGFFLIPVAEDPSL